MPNAETSSVPVPIGPRALLRIEALPAERHPAAVYLASLGSGSRRTMRQSLGVIANLVSGGRADVRTLKWEALRYQHCQAVRTALAERYAPGTTNKMLAALRGVLKEAWRLGLTSAENYHRAVDLKAIKSETLPRGRALSAGELRALFFRELRRWGEGGSTRCRPARCPLRGRIATVRSGRRKRWGQS